MWDHSIRVAYILNIMLTYIYSRVRIRVAVQFARDMVHITSVNFINLMDVVDCLSRGKY